MKQEAWIMNLKDVKYKNTSIEGSYKVRLVGQPLLYHSYFIGKFRIGVPYNIDSLNIQDPFANEGFTRYRRGAYWCKDYDITKDGEDKFRIIDFGSSFLHFHKLFCEINAFTPSDPIKGADIVILRKGVGHQTKWDFIPMPKSSRLTAKEIHVVNNELPPLDNVYNLSIETMNKKYKEWIAYSDETVKKFTKQPEGKGEILKVFK